MRQTPLAQAALLGLLLFQTWDGTSEDLPTDEASKKAEELAAQYAHRASQELARGNFESAEQLAIESLGLVPRRRITEEKRSAYRRQLGEILAELAGTPEGPRIDGPETDWNYSTSDVEDYIPLGFNQPGPPVASKEIVLPKVEFSATSLKVALDSLEVLGREFDQYPLIVDRGVKISLDAPSVVANTAITLQLTNVPLSEAIQRTAELGSCRVFHFGAGRSVVVFCVDLLVPVLTPTSSICGPGIASRSA